MIRRHMIMSAALATIALASCSGGDDDASPSPTPTPTGSVTPTPTASPTYVAFPLTAAVEFSTINSATSYTGDPSTGAVTLGVASTEMQSNRFRLATTNDFAAGTYVIRENTEEGRFVKANATTEPAVTAEEFVFRTSSTTTAGQFSQLEFLNNTIKDKVTTNTALQLTNVSYANWWRSDSTTGAKRITSGVFGYGTVPTDLPKTGTQAYTASVQGRVVSATGTVVRVSGSVTVSVNFGSGQVDVTMNLTTPNAAGTQVPYTTITAQGGLPVGQNQFTGAFSQGGQFSGTMAGGFFGSAGKEIGITFAGNGTVGGGNQRLVGTIVGKK